MPVVHILSSGVVIVGSFDLNAAGTSITTSGGTTITVTAAQGAAIRAAANEIARGRYVPIA